MTKDGSNARKKAARELAAAEQMTYTEALRRVDPGAGQVTRACGTWLPSKPPRSSTAKPA